MTPSQELFEAHLVEDDFKNGVVLGRWGVIPMEGVEWPHLVIWVSAAPRSTSPERYYFRFTLDDYSKTAPSAYVCTSEAPGKAPDDQWPTGINDVAMAFCINGWQHRNALYAPWDRAGLQAHPEWKDKYKGMAWESHFTIAHYLNRVFNLLNHDDYKGTVQARNP